MQSTQNSESTENPIKKFTPIFNDKYLIQKVLGDGSTSKVYLCTSIDDPSSKVALKVFKTTWLLNGDTKKNVKMVEKEITILQGLDHQNIVKILGYGSDGKVDKKNKTIHDIAYILMEYVEGGILFGMCQRLGGMGEDVGRLYLG